MLMGAVILSAYRYKLEKMEELLYLVVDRFLPSGEAN
jgi:hypothetical protein